MKTNSEVPKWVDASKVLDWEGTTPIHEGIISIQQMIEESKKLCNWLLFYCWCYARTNGFTNKCMHDWDYGNFGGKYKTSRDGVKDALSEFIKYDDTAMLAEQAEVEKLYNTIEAYCRGVIWNDPHPLPEPPKPEPKPPELPKPEPKPDPQPEPKPTEPKKPFPWLTIAKILVPIIGAVLTLGGLFLPGWAKTILDVILHILKSMI